MLPHGVWPSGCYDKTVGRKRHPSAARGRSIAPRRCVEEAKCAVVVDVNKRHLRLRSLRVNPASYLEAVLPSEFSAVVNVYARVIGCSITTRVSTYRHSRTRPSHWDH